jgi:hypothetical protein
LEPPSKFSVLVQSRLRRAQGSPTGGQVGESFSIKPILRGFATYNRSDYGG